MLRTGKATGEGVEGEVDGGSAFTSSGHCGSRVPTPPRGPPPRSSGWPAPGSAPVARRR